jgi:hypothetical protein
MRWLAITNTLIESDARRLPVRSVDAENELTAGSAQGRVVSARAARVSKATGMRGTTTPCHGGRTRAAASSTLSL